MEASEALVLYAMKMAIKGSVEEDPILASDMRVMVLSALQVLPPTSFDVLQSDQIGHDAFNIR